MVLPLSDSPNPRGVPIVNYAILAANVAVYVLISVPLSNMPADRSDPLFAEYVRVLGEHLGRRMPLEQILRGLSQYDLFVFEHGYRPASPSLGSLFFSIFLHGGFLHLFGNMLFLWIYGDNVEHRLGHLRYLFWYLLTGVAATLFHALFFPTSELPLVGASGAISGVLGFYFIWFPHNEVRMLLLIVPFFLRVVPLSARLVLGLYLFMDNVVPFLLTRGTGGTGVAFGAHIGGFLAGLAAAWWMDWREMAAPRDEYARGPRPATAPTAEGIRAAIRDGRLEDAARRYLLLEPKQTRGLLDPEELLLLGHWLAESGHARAAQAVYLRLLRDYPSGPAAAAAHVGIGTLQLNVFGEPTSAYQHFLDALDLDPSPEVEAQARAGLREIASLQKFRIGRSLRTSAREP